LTYVRDRTEFIFLPHYKPSSLGDYRMEEYRAYFVGHDGHFNGYEPIVCADDAEAVIQAKRLTNKHGVELWSGVRLVVRLSPEPR
jgi:hypothetical protein